MPLLAVIPFGAPFSRNRIFSSEAEVNRDDTLRPWIQLRDLLLRRGWDVATHDLVNSREVDVWLHLNAMGAIPASAPKQRTVALILEPEVIAPIWYRQMRAGEVDVARLLLPTFEAERFDDQVGFIPFPVSVPAHAPHKEERDQEIVMVNARKHVRGFRRLELYSKREQVAAWLARRGAIDIYGPGWDRRRRLSRPGHERALRRANHGPVHSKFTAFNRARFALTFENCRTPGYRSEKMFDAMAVGAIPIYFGDPTIAQDTPSQTYIDYSRLSGPAELLDTIRAMPESEMNLRRSAISDFLASPTFSKHQTLSFARRVAIEVEAVLDR